MSNDKSNYPFGNIMKSIDSYFQDKPSPYYLQSMNQFFNRNRGDNFPIQVLEGANSLKVEASLPGIAKKNIQINLYENELGIAVKGWKKRGAQMNNENEVEQIVPLPFQVRENDIHATYENGLLTVILPRMRKTGKQIEIKENGNQKNN